MKRSSTLCLASLIVSCSAPSSEAPACVDLTGAEIRALFADVIDRAAVQDGARGRARNHWCRDGRFTSAWRLPDGEEGQLEGRWWVEGDLRCVSIESGLPEGGGLERCGPVQRCGDRIGSVNGAGERHGWHELEPAPCPTAAARPGATSR